MYVPAGTSHFFFILGDQREKMAQFIASDGLGHYGKQPGLAAALCESRGYIAGAVNWKAVSGHCTGLWTLGLT